MGGAAVEGGRVIWWMLIAACCAAVAFAVRKMAVTWDVMRDSIDEETARSIRVGLILWAVALAIGFLLGVAVTHAAHGARSW